MWERDRRKHWAIDRGASGAGSPIAHSLRRPTKILFLFNMGSEKWAIRRGQERNHRPGLLVSPFIFLRDRGTEKDCGRQPVPSKEVRKDGMLCSSRARRCRKLRHSVQNGRQQKVLQPSSTQPASKKPRSIPAKMSPALFGFGRMMA